MKTALPASEEYYRLTRARELRRKADLTASWARGPCVCIAVAVWALAYFLALRVAASVPGAAALLLLLPVLGGLLVLLLDELFRRALRLRAEADALEAEHQARYGDLPVGKGS
jgi:hypothetical protein